MIKSPSVYLPTMIINVLLTLSPGAYAEAVADARLRADTAYLHALAFKPRRTLDRHPLHLPGRVLPQPVAPLTATRDGNAGPPGGDDRCDGGGTADCAAALATGANGLNDNLQSYGMFAVIGAGIRLPDAQLESEFGLEDDW